MSPRNLAATRTILASLAYPEPQAPTFGERCATLVYMLAAGLTGAVIALGAVTLSDPYAPHDSYQLEYVDSAGEAWIVDTALTIEDCRGMAIQPFYACVESR